MSMPFGMPFQPPTPEQIAEMEEQQRTNEVRMDEFRHAHQRLFEELDEDQLGALKQMLHFIVDGTGSVLAASWEGMASHALKTRFGICITCNVNHDKELHMEHDPAQQDKPVNKPDSREPQPEDVPLPTFGGELTEEDYDNMEKYHLDDARIEGTNELIGFACTGIIGANGPCGMIYPSIQDRMVFEPEHCSGCFVRMSQG